MLRQGVSGLNISGSNTASANTSMNNTNINNNNNNNNSGNSNVKQPNTARTVSTSSNNARRDGYDNSDSNKMLNSGPNNRNNGPPVNDPSNSNGTVINMKSNNGSSTARVNSGGSAGWSRSRRTKNSHKTLRKPMTPAETMRKYGSLLTPFEQSEVLEYHQVYFAGAPGAKKVKGIPHAKHNNGYDDERGDYKVIAGDQLEYRYEVLHVLGRGSFGQVVKVRDHKKDTILALKIIRNRKRFHYQALVEVKILERLMERDKEHKSNIVRVHGYFYFRNHLCITFELLSLNLFEFIKNNDFKGVSIGLIRRFAIQLLISLRFLKREKIIHCDLKPENILLKSPNKSTIKLIDFGSSCFQDERVYTYIQSRFYRSPEVILGLPYDIGIDMWSFGCILAELYTGYPLFPGGNEHEQIQCIMEIVGLPPIRLIKASKRRSNFFDENLKPILVANARGKVRMPGVTDLGNALKCNDNNFISFLRRCLRWDPKTRMTPEKAFEHPWIAEATIRRSIPGSGSGYSKSSSSRSSSRRRRSVTGHKASKHRGSPVAGNATGASSSSPKIGVDGTSTSGGGSGSNPKQVTDSSRQRQPRKQRSLLNNVNNSSRTSNRSSRGSVSGEKPLLPPIQTGTPPRRDSFSNK